MIAAMGALLGYIWGNLYFGIILAGIIAIVYGLIMYNTGDKMVLKMAGARPVTKKEHPHLYHTVEGLALAAGMPTPQAYVIDDTALNAFATGKDPQHASITVTTGMLSKMNRQELEGVIAHEMSHIANFDIRFMLLTVVLLAVVTVISQFLLRSFLFGRRKEGGIVMLAAIAVAIIFAILTPIIGELIKLSVSRKREYMADARGATLTRYPPGLASALEKIKNDPDPMIEKANRGTAHLFISTPFFKKKGVLSGLWSTHPPLEERIKRLKEM